PVGRDPLRDGPGAQVRHARLRGPIREPAEGARRGYSRGRGAPADRAQRVGDDEALALPLHAALGGDAGARLLPRVQRGVSPGWIGFLTLKWKTHPPARRGALLPPAALLPLNYKMPSPARRARGVTPVGGR